MALSPVTPRDRVQQLLDIARKALRYWWLVGLFAVLGVGLSFAFALSRPKSFQSFATLFYQERIKSSLLQNREDTTQRNIGDRFRELLLARTQLVSLLEDKELKFIRTGDLDLQLERLRTAIRFEARGANAFRIVYADGDPERARAVTDKLTKNLQSQEESLRNELAQSTVTFAITQKDAADVELRKAEQTYTGFLAKHSEFIPDNNNQSEGASLRAANKKPIAPGNAQLSALDRQRDRILARLNASPDAPPVRVSAPPTAEKLAAEQAVGEAQRELAQTQRDLDDALGKYTDQHPTVKKLKVDLATARQKLAHAQAGVPPDQEMMMAPATAEDRENLKKQLVQLEAQINAIQANAGKATPAVDTTTKSVVDLETEYADLRRQQFETRERVQSLADSVFRAQLDANQKAAEAGGRLTVIDPAFKPMRPTGTGKMIYLMAGMVLFLGLGFALAIGLALIDDRIYRRTDIDAINLAVLAVIPPHQKRKASKATRRGKS
ncbi:MAG: hypothetical protein NT062_37890 [Proteobacteria bacterium]|nr:hypothetical protein [Pseudomonadota bacterium]